MKKVFLAILSLLYIISSIGVTLHAHYCMNLLTDRATSHHETKMADKCGNGKINKKFNDCCRTENKLVKNDNDQQVTESIFQLTPAIALPPSFIEFSISPLRSITQGTPINHPPPGPGSLSLYIRNRIFLI